ncbi:hypothetical protein METBIDRAFT_42097 [Metschnikowia bicuspidata var. bicuspidata NRRL YB-4993]|uniref:Uncharacterized protein n=1 Tax=Metschnikowia bicuspidata var. bicuspidata NRRL YB-4993 TaxID=869754 RepID=A0A1A0HBF1_9ASCO|nr:hypothetical protein METBIDRAFT_42097 [Metschnikowia bicuspidata var. bicuspidata NRRL YB-4993]OBA21315.1 hypothetical protein METBIDRAFT_42097 [Metschnikowia bicuspidata var. bicuspidata NRRL YB-4993]
MDSANAQFFSLVRSAVIGMAPRQVEALVAANTAAGRFRRNLDIAARIRQDPLKRRFLKRSLYLALLALLAAEADRSTVGLALQLFREMAAAGGDPHELAAAVPLLYASFHNCGDFTQLLGLKAVFQAAICRADPGPAAAAGYYACHMHVLLNTGQTALATAHFHRCLGHMAAPAGRAALFRQWPLDKHIRALVASQDCGALAHVLDEVLAAAAVRLVRPAVWAEILGLALWKNSLAVVRFVYTHVVMHGVAPRLPGDAALDAQAPPDNAVLGSLSGATLAQMLHTFALHGDVALCLHLVEWHFVHKPMRGERALTKDLCLLVIRAYCFHRPDAGAAAQPHEEDASVKTVLEVVDAFVARRRHRFDYADLAEAFLYTLSTYHVFDANVAAARSIETSARPLPPSAGRPDDPLDPPDAPPLLEKKSNRNVHESAQGSVLKNTAILQDFVAEHWRHLARRLCSPATVQIFVNCLLWHLATHQNTSGVVLALQLMKAEDSLFAQKWLDASLYDIIARSVSGSPAAMATGLVLYEHMKQAQAPVSEQNFRHLVHSSLRGDAYNPLLEYYMYEYLRRGAGHVCPRLVSRIRAFKKLNDDGRVLLRCLDNFRPLDLPGLDALWDAHLFTRRCPELLLAADDDDYARFFHIDQRDKDILMLVLA